MHTSHRYALTDVATLKVDTLDTNNYGGVSLLPVRSPGFDPEAQLNRLKTKASVSYTEYVLTNALWTTNGVQTSVPLHLSEGFFLYKPTNATWTVTREIW